MKLKIPSVVIFNLKRLKRVSMSCYYRIRAHRHLRNLKLMSITRSGKSTDFLYSSIIINKIFVQERCWVFELLNLVVVSDRTL